MAISTFGIYVSQKEVILISKNVAIMCGMHIINGVHNHSNKSVISLVNDKNKTGPKTPVGMVHVIPQD